MREVYSLAEHPRLWLIIFVLVDEYPEGYPQFAALLCSDDSFTIFRRFGRLTSRILIHSQNELTELEKELDRRDVDDAADATLEPRLRGYEGFQADDNAQRELIHKIRPKLSEYCDYLPVVRANKNEILTKE